MMNPLFATGHIALWLLIAGLFFPRLALFVAWFGTGTYPPNPLPVLFNLELPDVLERQVIFIDGLLAGQP
jgi:hypothetical protein